LSPKREPQRIVSLLPAATETLFALGLKERVVGISHACDHPEAVKDVPRVTKSLIDGHSSRAIDEQVRQRLHEHKPLFEIDSQLLSKLKPDLIITQHACKACAVTPDGLEAALKPLKRRPEVLSLEAHTLEGVFQDAYRIGGATGTLDEARAMFVRQWGVLKQVRRQVEGRERRTTVVLDWVDPPMAAGHWVPELVKAAGGEPSLVAPGEPSCGTRWPEITKARPQVLVLASCGRTLDETAAEWTAARSSAKLATLETGTEGRIYAADGDAFFSRPGPRLVYAAAILARLIHPEIPALPDSLEMTYRRLG
jgi:iron complex transport system substrate-binding protein